MRKPSLILLVLLVMAWPEKIVCAADWPQWRGPTRNGVAASGPKLLAQLSEEQELPLVWESEEIPSDQDGGHGSVIVADGRVYVALVWHKRIPKDERVIDDKLIRSIGYRKVELAPETLAKHENDRMKLNPRLRGSKLDEWIKEWVEANLNEQEQQRYYGFFQDRFRKGKLARPLKELDRFAEHEYKEFPNEKDIEAWLAKEKFSEALVTELLRRVSRDTLMADEVVLCLDAKTGKKVWEMREPTKPIDRRASSTPVVADGRIHAIVGRTVRTLDAMTGKSLWSYPMKYENGVPNSPMVMEGKLIFCDDRLKALDAKTGKLTWEQEVIRGREASVIPWRDVVLCHTSDSIQAARAADGKFLWKVPGGGQSTPVVSDDLLVLVSYKKKGVLAYALAKDAEPKQRWSISLEAKRHAASPIAHDGLLYLMGGGRHLCVSLKDGGTRWSEQVNCELSSPILTGNRLLVLERNGGHLAMVATDSTSYQPLGKARIQVMKAASPALADGYIFFRKKDKVACYDLRAK
jgi:outer membrane protein assembly factor BamB